ncbi:unnamed protein product [Boreogadus saida]
MWPWLGGGAPPLKAREMSSKDTLHLIPAPPPPLSPRRRIFNVKKNGRSINVDGLDLAASQFTLLFSFFKKLKLLWVSMTKHHLLGHEWK